MPRRFLNAQAIREMITREEFSEFKEENFARLDKMARILERLDQERLFTFEAVKRIETEVDKQREEIDTIQERLKAL